MRFLAISGSIRRESTNTALLRYLCRLAQPDHDIGVYEGLAGLPIFTPDLEGDDAPAAVLDLARKVGAADGLILSSPEYVRSIPGGIKNAIDWLVPREELVEKPVALLHASHRGDDMLESLRLVLNTVTGRFQEDNFVRIPLMARSPGEIHRILSEPQNRSSLREFVDSFANFVTAGRD